MAPKAKKVKSGISDLMQKAEADQIALVFDSRRPRLAVTLHPGSQTSCYPGRDRAPFQLCLLSSDGSRFCILEAFDKAARGGSILYKQEKGSRGIGDLPGQKIAELNVDPFFGAMGSMMYELTQRKQNEILSLTEEKEN